MLANRRGAVSVPYQLKQSEKKEEQQMETGPTVQRLRTLHQNAVQPHQNIQWYSVVRNTFINFETETETKLLLSDQLFKMQRC